MIDLLDGMEKEEDLRNILTDPLNYEDRQKYENQINPFVRASKNKEYDDLYQPNNCVGMPFIGSKKVPMDLSKIRVKVTQTGDDVMSGEEYDREMEKRLRQLFNKQENLLDQRKDDERIYENNNDNIVEDSRNDSARKKQRDSKFRGRKDKYYEQVEDEDLSFAEDSERAFLFDKGEADSGQNTPREDVNLLDKIEEEG